MWLRVQSVALSMQWDQGSVPYMVKVPRDGTREGDGNGGGRSTAMHAFSSAEFRFKYINVLVRHESRSVWSRGGESSGRVNG